MKTGKQNMSQRKCCSAADLPPIDAPVDAGGILLMRSATCAHVETPAGAR